jgi:C4-dicarboxylate transporter, DctM subunit
VSEALVALIATVLLSFLRVPLAISMGLVGFAGLASHRGLTVAGASLSTTFFETGFQYSLSVVPLFILMGNFVARAGMADELYRAAHAFIGHLRGGLAMATILACAGFGAICGSSIATAATMAKVAYPSMKQFGYADSLSTGAIAAGGTLGILIPPSVIMVLYGLMTETSIGALFAAGVLPGLLACGLLCASIGLCVARNPELAPRGASVDASQRWRALAGVKWVVLLFAIVMGGIYGGIFTATEGAGIGSTGGFLIALSRRSLSRPIMMSILRESARTTAMMFSVLIGALVFANFINFTSMTADLIGFVKQFAIHPMIVVAAICVIYVLLGAAMEELSMILLTVPVFFPLIKSLGFNPVWFGILIVVVVQIGMISPPIGMNLFVVRKMVPQVSTQAIFLGVLPFNLALIVLLVLLIVFPSIVLFLPMALKLAG